MDSDCQTKWEFGCNARPLGRIKCLSSWVTWSSSSRTRAPRCRMMVRCVIRVSSMGFLPKGLQLHSQVLPQNAPDHHFFMFDWEAQDLGRSNNPMDQTFFRRGWRAICLKYL
jgi:hypothetical protein